MLKILNELNFYHVKNMAIANMKARYRKTFAGLIWVILNPLIMYAVQSVVFKKFLKLQVPNYYLFLLGGLLPWIFIVQTLDMCTPILDGSKELLKSFKMDPKVLVLAQVIDNFFNFMLTALLLLIPYWMFFSSEVMGALFFPIGVIVLLFGLAGLVWFLSVLNVFYHDTRFVVQFLTSIFFFLTPIFYPIEYVPEKYRIFIDLNPFYALINPIRICIYNFNMIDFSHAIFRSLMFSLFFIFCSHFFWKRRRNEFYLHL